MISALWEMILQNNSWEVPVEKGLVNCNWCGGGGGGGGG